MADPAPLGFVFEAVRQIRAALRPDLPLIGFAGAPFTLACYAIEGGGSRHYETAKTFMYRDPGAWDVFMATLVDATVVYLQAQAEAGAQVLQLFDSLGRRPRPRRLPTVRPAPHETAVRRPARDVPTIHFGTGTGRLAGTPARRRGPGHRPGLAGRAGPDLGPARARRSPSRGTSTRPSSWPLSRNSSGQARRVLDEAGGRPGHIFNLGHGVLPGTSVDHVRVLVDFVHETTRHSP